MAYGRTWVLFFGLMFVVVGLVVMVVFGQVSVLQCTRPEPSQVECVKEVRWLNVVPMRKERIKDLRGARVDEWNGTYRVVLKTGEGEKPLGGYYSSAERGKEEIAAQINTYVEKIRGDSLEVQEGNGIVGALVGVVFVVTGVGMAIGKARAR